MQNLHKVYSYNFFWIFVIILPVLYPYYATLGVSMHEFFQLQAVFGLTIALTDIPMGYFSDRFGRKLSLCTGAIVSGISYWVLTQATGFWGLALHEFLLGLALSFVSGTDIALLYESVADTRERDKTSQVIGHNQLATTLGESLAALLCSFFMIWGYKRMIAIQAVIAWIPFLIALTLKEQPHKKKEYIEWKKVKEVTFELFVNNKIVRLLSMNFVLWLLASFVIVWINQKYWQENNVPTEWFGFVWCLFNLTIGIVGLWTRTWEKQQGIVRLLAFVAVASTLGYLGMALIGGWVGVLLGILIYVARGINNVVSRDILNQHIPHSLRATSNSVLNFFFRMTFALLGPAVGLSMDVYGVRATLFVLAVFFALSLFFITWPLLKLLKLQNIAS